MMVMRRAFRYAFLALLLVGLAALSWQVGHSQGEDSRYFSATGHYVRGEFLTFYSAVPYPELVYGFPITDAFINNQGIEVQYFNRARFERSSNGEIARTPLGRLLYTPGRILADIDETPAACRSFTSGFPVCMNFLTFFDAHGGLEQFGLPISRAEKAGDRTVQYFEYARLEWRPEQDDPQLLVSLSDLGRSYFYEVGEDMVYMSSSANPPSVIDITGLQVHTFTASTSARLGESLSLFVIVQNQTYKAVPGANILLEVTGLDGLTYRHAVTANDNGFAEIRLPLLTNYFPAGKVTVRATASYDGLEKLTLTSFTILP